MCITQRWDRIKEMAFLGGGVELFAKPELDKTLLLSRIWTDIMVSWSILLFHYSSVKFKSMMMWISLHGFHPSPTNQQRPEDPEFNPDRFGKSRMTWQGTTGIVKICRILVWVVTKTFTDELSGEDSIPLIIYLQIVITLVGVVEGLGQIPIETFATSSYSIITYLLNKRREHKRIEQNSDSRTDNVLL
jgi:hypothetical protein